MVSTRSRTWWKLRGSLPGHGIADTRQDGGKLFDQVWPVPGLFQLLDDAYDDIIVDSICVDLVVCWSTR